MLLIFILCFHVFCAWRSKIGLRLFKSIIFLCYSHAIFCANLSPYQIRRSFLRFIQLLLVINLSNFHTLTVNNWVFIKWALAASLVLILSSFRIQSWKGSWVAYPCDWTCILRQSIINIRLESSSVILWAAICCPDHSRVRACLIIIFGMRWKIVLHLVRSSWKVWCIHFLVLLIGEWLDGWFVRWLKSILIKLFASLMYWERMSFLMVFHERLASDIAEILSSVLSISWLSIVFHLGIQCWIWR